MKEKQIERERKKERKIATFFVQFDLMILSIAIVASHISLAILFVID